MIFSKQLTYWYLHNKRNLPWRNTLDPYTIWLSEIILQQTRVEQGTSYYLRFINNFPTVFDLAIASEEQVLKLWQGLGYYSRARNLHFSAKYIVNDLNGNFPASYKELLKLKGVGDYTASAIASVCFNEPTAVVDGNVYRVLSRYFGIDTAINSSAGIKIFKQLAQQLIDENNPGTHNQAIMEFGALMCKPGNPDCEICPLNSSCFAVANNSIKKLPVKEKKAKIRTRYFNYLVVHSSDHKTKIVKREAGIWRNLYEFPLIETDDVIDMEAITEHAIFKELFDGLSAKVKLFDNDVLVHKLTHQHIHTKFWVVTTTASDHFSIPWKAVEKYPVSALIDNFLNRYKSD
ncbi:MAG: A/G-specific adenine glycosylase [Lutibacter sp.]|nr:A/G-specific adenine glycosylase [Lutibacter sp.]MDT8417096.1 A/G-specific adenine glycosylase [Lutibacter sp.]